MGIVVTKFDSRHVREMGGLPLFDSFCFQAWERTALAAHDYVAFLLDEREKTTPSLRAYLGLEIIASSLETMEYLATTCARVWGTTGGLSHMAENSAIHAAFTRMAEGPLSAVEVATLLRLPRSVPRLRNLEDSFVLRRVYSHVLRNGRSVLRDAGRVWLRQIDRARWFRHFPAFLSPRDTFLIDPKANPDRDAGLAALSALEDCILAYALQDGNRFSHEALRERDIAEARALARASLDILDTRNSNAVLAPSSSKPEESRLKMVGVLLHGLSQGDRDLLRDHGRFFLA